MTEDQSVSRDKTGLAAVCGIFFVVPALMPAAIVVFIYKNILQSNLEHNWIPYLDKIAILWFPELLRGMIVGGLSMYATELLFKNFNKSVVAYVVLAFWCGVALLATAIAIARGTISIESIGIIALMVGLGLGLFVPKEK